MLENICAFIASEFCSENTPESSDYIACQSYKVLMVIGLNMFLDSLENVDSLLGLVTVKRLFALVG